MSIIKHNNVNTHITRYILDKKVGKQFDMPIKSICEYMGVTKKNKKYRSYYILILNLVKAVQSNNNSMFISSDKGFYSKKVISSKGLFLPNHVSYTYSRDFIQSYQELGFGVHNKGYNFECKSGMGRVSKIGTLSISEFAVGLVMGLCSGRKLNVDLDKMFIKLKSGDKMNDLYLTVDKGFLRGVQLRMKAYNEFLSEWDVFYSGGKINTETDRMFKESVNYYGRLHGQYQNLTKEERNTITFNDGQSVEIDIKASHPSILYAISDHDVPDDVYDCTNVNRYLTENHPDIPLLDRNDYKLLMMVLINSKSYVQMIKALQFDKDWTDKFGTKSSTIGVIVEFVQEDKYEISSHFFSEQSLKLMLMESDLVLSVVEELMDIKIPCLTVHDSFIVPKEDMLLVVDIIANKFFEKFGKYCHLKCDNG